MQGRRREETAGTWLIPPPFLFLIPAIAGWGLDRFVLRLEFMPGAPGLMIGLSLIALALTLMGAATVEMRRARTSPEPWKPASALVTSGPFSFSRNPIYLAYATGYVGLAFLLGTLWILLLLPLPLVAVHRGFIVREERYLARRFGQEYEEYRNRVRRWF